MLLFRVDMSWWSDTEALTFLSEVTFGVFHFPKRRPILILSSSYIWILCYPLQAASYFSSKMRSKCLALDVE